MDRMAELKRKAASLPLKPGVYLMMGVGAEVIYVGKAKALKNRVSQYFQDSASHSAKTLTMVSQIVDFDTLIAQSEFEALVLEASLIKRHQPRYNILLKDAKGYPFIRSTIKDAYPRFELANKWKNDGALYFGPYGGRQATRNVIGAVCATFRLPVCERQFPRDIGKDRPCLQYHMGRCIAPCRGCVSPEELKILYNQAVSVLEGKFTVVADAIRAEMEAASDALLFEKAAALRDRRNDIIRLGMKQKVVSGSMADTDVVGVAVTQTRTCIAVLHYIDGALFDRDVAFVGQEISGRLADTVSAFVGQYYLPRRSFPRQILLPVETEDADVRAEWLSGLAGHKVEVLSPKRGEKRSLLALAETNAREEALRLTTREEHESALLALLAPMLNLPAPPRRIEAYDISHTAGQDTVGAMTVFVNAAPLKKDYRRFRIREEAGGDDYEAMREVLTRRFRRCQAGDKGFETQPDLLLMDGGQAHAALAVSVLAQFNLTIPVYGMVKDGRHRTRALVSPSGLEVGLAGNPAVFAFIGRIQEETHRSAIRFHHEQHRKKAVRSELLGIPGLGPARREALLRHYKAVKHVKSATVEELAAVVPKKTAESVYAHFHASNGSDSASG